MRRIFRRRCEDGQIDQVAFIADAAVEHDSNSASRKGGAILFFTTRARVRSPPTFALFDRAGAADVDADGGRKTLAPGRRSGFGIAEHHADFLADLIDEDDRAFGFGNRAGELAECLLMRRRLEARVRVAHFAFDFGAGDERGDGCR